MLLGEGVEGRGELGKVRNEGTVVAKHTHDAADVGHGRGTSETIDRFRLAGIDGETGGGNNVAQERNRRLAKGAFVEAEA